MFIRLYIIAECEVLT